MQGGRRKTLLPARSQRVPHARPCLHPGHTEVASGRPSLCPPPACWSGQSGSLVLPPAQICNHNQDRRSGVGNWKFPQRSGMFLAFCPGGREGVVEGGLFTICWWLQPRQVLLNRQKATTFRPRVEEGPDGQTWRLSGCRRSATPDVSSCGSNFLPAPT